VKYALDPRPVHIVIPDTQVDPGVPTAHLNWIGRYIADKFGGRPGVKVIHLGDHWNMGSLSSYDKKGGIRMEGRRYDDDFEAGNEAFKLLSTPIEKRMARKDGWTPELHFLFGNHENRVNRAVEQDAQLDGLLSLDWMDTRGWERHDFLAPLYLDGVTYAHYFYNPMNGRAIGGMIETRLKTIGRSFTQGHQQTLMYGLRPAWTDGKPSFHHGLVAGACYLHDEDYLGPQGNTYWRGIVVCHGVEGGTYNPMFVDLDYLCRRYEGVTLEEFAPGIGTGRRAA